MFEAAGQCPQVEHSIYAMFLRGHTFKTYKVGWPQECFLRCDEDVTCQSYNFDMAQKVCELNNRTKEARPEDFMPDRTRYYMKRANNRGTLFSSCMFLFSTMAIQPFSRAHFGFFRCQFALCLILFSAFVTKLAGTYANEFRASSTHGIKYARQNQYTGIFTIMCSSLGYSRY